MNILSPPRTDYYIHLFVERRADVTRARSPFAKAVAMQAFTASLAELINEMCETRQRQTRDMLIATILAVGLTPAEMNTHIDGAIGILKALDNNLHASASFPAAILGKGWAS